MSHNHHLLIADSNPDTRRQTARMLESTVYQVWQADTWAACVEHVRSKHPGLILIDADFPNIDKIKTVVEQLKALSGWKDTFIVLVFEEGRVALSAVEKADVWITRPFSKQELLGRVQDWFRLRESHERLHKAEAKWRLSRTSNSFYPRRETASISTS